jgi:hypothetical protein
MGLLYSTMFLPANSSKFNGKNKKRKGKQISANSSKFQQIPANSSKF